MTVSAKKLPLFLVLLAVHTPSFGADLFSQGSPNNSWFPGDSNYLTVGGRAADNFVLSQEATITGIDFWGQVFNSTGQSFEATFWEDSAGTPGNALLTTTLTGYTASPGSGVHLYESVLTNSFSADANTTYWLTIFNTAGDAQWGWSASTDASDYSVQFETPSGSGWQELNGSSTSPVDTAFVLSGTAVPEPSTLALLGLGGLLLARRRR